VRQHSPLPYRGALAASNQNGVMIATFDLDLKRIASCGLDYPWPRPSQCGRCEHHCVWGHGFVLMNFAGFSDALMIRRYRCPACGCVIRLRPCGYFRRHQSPTATIRRALACRLSTGRWPSDCVTNRGRHWLTALKRNALAILSIPWQRDLMAAFERLIALGRVPVSRAI